MPLRTDFGAMNCSLARALQQVGDPWTLLLLRECLLGAERFEDFARALGLARQVLATRLAQMAADGLIERLPLVEPDPGTARVDATAPAAKRAAYRLTDKGRDLAPTLLALFQWGDRWVSGRGREPVVATDASGASLARMAIRTRAGDVVAPAELRWKPGPGSDAMTRAHLAHCAHGRKAREAAQPPKPAARRSR